MEVIFNNTSLDLASVNNRYTDTNPIQTATGSRWWTQDDQVVADTQIDNTVPVLPGTPALTTRTIIEVSNTASYTDIQNAINGAPQHSVLHIPGGIYSVSQTITVPANLDIILYGDCGATQILWSGASGGGPILRLFGPSKTTIIDITFNGGRATETQAGGNAIFIDTPDQPGAKIYAEGARAALRLECVQSCLLVNRCSNTIVESHNLCHRRVPNGAPFINNNNFRNVKVVGNGGVGAGYTAIFNLFAASCDNNGAECLK